MAQRQNGRQEGSRWIDAPPDPKEFASWFKANVKLHEGLDHADYLPGVILIPNKEKVREVQVDESGRPMIRDVERLVFTPYPKVETRIQYFWDFCRVGGYLGAIETEQAPASKHLPAGFFQMPVSIGPGVTMPFVGVSYRVRVWERDSRVPSGRGHDVMLPAPGAKVVPLLTRGYSGAMKADDDAIHKAQTGAQGRALGNAGMLIVPGAGIATYEDMMEFLAGGDTAPAAVPELPPVAVPEQAATPAGLDELVKDRIERLRSEHPQGYEEARAWAHEKGFNLDEPPESALRALERMLSRKLATARTTASA